MRLIFGPDLVAEIYRHSSEALTAPPLQPQVDEVLAAVAQAGAELVRDGKVSEATMAALTQELAPPAVMQEIGRQFWAQALAQAGDK
jgi:hypothetical protein